MGSNLQDNYTQQIGPDEVEQDSEIGKNLEINSPPKVLRKLSTEPDLQYDNTQEIGADGVHEDPASFAGMQLLGPDVLDSDVRKIDPDDGQAYSFKELYQKYLPGHAPEVYPDDIKSICGHLVASDGIKTYWDNECAVEGWPEESAQWSAFVRRLFSQSHGCYHPDQMAAAYRRVQSSNMTEKGQAELEALPGRVSICVPTTQIRQMFHKQLWMMFDLQAWEDKELVVVETFQTSPSP